MPAGRCRVTATVHVLAYGTLDIGVTDTMRVGCLVDPLAALGVEVRSWQSFADDLLSGNDRSAAASQPPTGDFLRDAGLTAMAWADVILFRRFHSTHSVCTECEAAFPGTAEHEAHLRSTGHFSVKTDPLFRHVVDLIAANPSLLGGRGIVYETDDDLLDCPDWTGIGPTTRRERDLIQRLLLMADLVTTTTPVLAERLASIAPAPVRVIRNAINPAWYTAAVPDDVARAPGDPRVVYHGVPVRLRDYQVARPAVDAVAAEHPGMRRVWLGAANERRVIAAMDEVRPWVDGPRNFAAALVAARPEVGLAPLVDEPFNLAKSELHWLEYSMAGAATIVSGFSEPGPYDVVRDGVDGLVARTDADWLRHMRALAGSRDLRTELAGRARERVLGDYDVAERAGEWADAYRWAAAHGGSRLSPAARGKAAS